MIRKIFSYFFNHIADLKRQNGFFYDHRYKRFFLIGGMLFILGWQLVFVMHRNQISDKFARLDATGFNHNTGKEFFYFYYYKGLFPLVTTARPLDYSSAGAENSIRNNGDSLLMEWKHWYRYGEHCRILCYLPGAWIKGSAEDPSLLPFNTIVFILSLLMVFGAFWKNKMPLTGFIMVIIFGSSPFLLYEVYRNENIFGLMIVTLLITFSLNLHFMRSPFVKWKYLVFPLVSGIIIASSANMRAEIKIVAACLLIVYLTIPKTAFWKKIIVCAVLAGGYFIANVSWKFYFDRKFEKTHELVIKNGGNPFDGLKVRTHPFWHPVFCGLGDFDTRYGYQWDDERAAYRYALPILNSKYHMNISLPDTYSLALNEYYDPQKKYYKKMEEIPEYEVVMRDKVLSDIKKDPGWYLTIIGKRLAAVFTETSPVAIAWGRKSWMLPFSGLLLLPFLLLLLIRKKWFFIRLLIFSLPLAATSMIIYAKKGTTFNSCFHLFLAVLIISWLIEGIIVLYQKKIKKKTDG